MANVNLSDIISDISSRGRIMDADCALVRRAVFEDGKISTMEADRLFALNDLQDKCETWDMLFVEALTHFLVRQTMPHGYVNQANATWLLARISHDGVVESRTELELLIYVMKQAHNVTENLEIFALNQAVESVLNGRGYMGKNRTLEPGVITEDDVKLLRRVLYACASEGGVGITRREAEVLFDLNDTTINAKNHPSWTKLFVGGIANHIMMVAAWNEPDAQEALRREKWLEVESKSIIPKMHVPGISNIFGMFKNFSSEDQPQYMHTNGSTIAVAERVTQSEAHWLIERLDRDNILHENEKELLRFLKEESPQIHQSLSQHLKAV
ncbi:MAG: hypothetical protein V3U57_08950 [Robiginitomaculum sp.]